MSFLSKALVSIGTNLLGTGISKAGSWLFGQLPQGAQSFLSGVGSSIGITTQADLKKMTSEQLAAYYKSKNELRDLKGPTPTMLGVTGGNAQTNTLQRAGQAQLLPLGGTDRVSRALQDARVAEKIMRMAGQAPIPSPNLRGGQTIGLSSATPPSTRLAKKFS